MHESRALHLLLAASTKRIECGVLAYCAPFRPVGESARSIATASAVSGVRCVEGIGAGWRTPDFELWVLPFGTWRSGSTPSRRLPPSSGRSFAARRCRSGTPRRASGRRHPQWVDTWNDNSNLRLAQDRRQPTKSSNASRAAVAPSPKEPTPRHDPPHSQRISLPEPQRTGERAGHDADEREAHEHRDCNVAATVLSP